MKKYLYKGNKIQIIEKKSKFIAESFKVETVEECEEILSNIRKKYWDATHNCYAYRIDSNNKKCSDDGEPSRTAGYPILDVIDKQEINNCLIVVTRYFGGILLGTGGLVRAYSSSASSIIEASTIIEVNEGFYTEVNCDYESYGKVLYLFNEKGIHIKNSTFTDRVVIESYILKRDYDHIEKSLKEILKKDAPFSFCRNVNFTILYGEVIEYE